jgi:pimeloyl-ACP methyl ester carboxylesterase
MTVADADSIQPQVMTIDGLKVRYADSGGAFEQTVLLTSPWPESIYAFTRMWPTLTQHTRVFAVDLPGFGASERRDELLAPRAMGGFLTRLVDEADLGKPHVVAPDVGTSAALFAAAARPDLFASVTIGSGAAAVPLELGEPLRSRVLDDDLDAWRRKDPREIVGTSLDTIAGGIPESIRADYLASYEGDRYVESMRYVRAYPKELPDLAELLPQVTTPVTLVNGSHDRVVPLANVEFLYARLPNSRLVILDAGHFAGEEAPREYAATILDSVLGMVR